MIKTAVVFGATGLVGKELVYELLEDQDYTKVITVLRKNLPIANSKLVQILVSDFTQILQFKENLNADVYFCCIGTTIKKAGSQEAFRKIDHDIPVDIAQMANELTIPNMVVISSIGANAVSSNFYLRTKGEMEKEVREKFQGNLKIVRPSFLMGHRDEFRLGEKISIYAFKVLNILMIGPLRKYRGIYAWDVAKAMIKSTDLPKEKTILESDELQNLVIQNRKTYNSHEIIK